MAVTTDIQKAVDMWIKKRCCQIDIYQLDFKLTGKEVIGKVECLSDVPQKMVKDEIVVAGSQNDMVEQIGIAMK